VQRFVTKVNQARLTPATGEATVCGTYVEVSDETGLATRVEPVRIGGRLTPHIPQV
jgi:calcineurin-like phosphoesterase